MIVTQRHGRPSTQISRKLVVLGYIVAGFGSFWLVLLVLWVVLGGFVGGFGWFWVVPCFSNYVVSSQTAVKCGHGFGEHLKHCFRAVFMSTRF